MAPFPEAIRVFPASTIPNRWQRNLWLLFFSARADYLVIHFSLVEVVFFAVFLWPFRCRIVTLDFFAGGVRPWLLPLVRWSLRRVWKLLVYFKNPTIFVKLFGLSAAKFQYVPFKINAYELVLAEPHRDDGYIFSGGRSRRDSQLFSQPLKTADTRSSC